MLQFSSDIWHASGSCNIVADAWSCLPVCSLSSASMIALIVLAFDQPQLSSLDVVSEEFTTCQFLYLLLPASERERYCVILHLGHLVHSYQSLTVTLSSIPCIPYHILVKQLLGSCSSFWLNMRCQITEWTHACRQCQRLKVHCHVHSTFGSFQCLNSCFQHIHIDTDSHTSLPPLIGFHIDLKPSYLLTLILNPWHKPSSRIGFPTLEFVYRSQWTMKDNSNHRLNFNQISAILGVHHIRMTSYHPTAYSTVAFTGN